MGPEAAPSPRHLGQALPDQRDLLAAQRHGLHDGAGERLRGVSVAPGLEPAARLTSPEGQSCRFRPELFFFFFTQAQFQRAPLH